MEMTSGFFLPFAGGFGGWTHALHFLRSHGYETSRPLALGICRDAAKTYSLMHGSKLIENTIKIQDLSSLCIVVADVLQQEPSMAASILQINTTTLNIPCVTFSSAGMMQ